VAGGKLIEEREQVAFQGSDWASEAIKPYAYVEKYLTQRRARRLGFIRVVALAPDIGAQQLEELSRLME
jgi:hypothetical protein